MTSQTTPRSTPAEDSAIATCFNPAAIDTFSRETFFSNQPYPWANFKALLTPQAFTALYQEFPSLDFFEKHEGMARKHGQKPHDRYYLAYEEKIDAYTKLDSAQERAQNKGVMEASTAEPFMP